VGIFGNIVSFGAGYTLGATKGGGPIRRLQNTITRGADPTPTSRVLRRDAKVRDVMTPAPETVSLGTPLTAAAHLMANQGIGDVIVIEPKTGRVAGIITDRDIAIRAVAEGRNPDATTVEEIFSRDLAAVSPADSVARVLQLMEDLKVRRLPVVEADRAVGIVSLGDLAVGTNVGSALAEISAAAPDH
jgi:CBS domain-containing protein